MLLLIDKLKHVIIMKIFDFSSNKFKNLIKMLVVSSLVLAYFIYYGINNLSDVVFPIIFIILIIRYFKD